MATQKIKGKVKWFNITKGYGFITGEDGKDTFVHFSGIDKGRTYIGLNIDDEVEFEITNGEKGPQAENVVLLSDPNAKPATKPSKK